MNELASCVAARKADSASPAGSAGAFEASAKATGRYQAYWSFGAESLTADAVSVVGSGRA
jgi:hypothetical protein